MSRKLASLSGRFVETRSRAARIAIVFLAVSAGCGREPSLEPPVVHYGQTACAHCNMIVNEERFAVASLVDTDEGEAVPFVFDDVSCLFAFERAHPEAAVRMRFVHDARTGEWINASSASYVRSGDIRSPMGGGVLASGDAAFAESLRAEHASEITSFERLSIVFEKGN